MNNQEFMRRAWVTFYLAKGAPTVPGVSFTMYDLEVVGLVDRRLRIVHFGIWGELMDLKYEE